MLTGSIGGLGHLDAILDRLKRVQDLDLGPLARTITQLLVEGNRDGLLAGLDADGAPMAPLASSTRSHRVGSGPPGVPDFAASSLIRGFRVEVDITPSGFQIRAGWDRSVPQARFFSLGTARQPARNLSGIRPDTKAKITQAVNDFAASVVNSI